MKKIIQFAILLLTVLSMVAFAATDYFPRSVENMYTLENNHPGVGRGDFNFFFDLTQGIPAWMYDNDTVSQPAQKGEYTFTTGEKKKKTKQSKKIKESDTITYQSNK